MKRRLIAVGAALMFTAGAFMSSAIVSPLAAQSAPTEAGALETTTLAVENMHCALCPVTVRKAMEGVEGVLSVEVDFDAKTATVTFDPSATSLTAIATASTNAGYPAHPAG